MCVSSPAALDARRQLGPAYYTLHASAQRRPVVLDIAASAFQVRRKASQSPHGQQLHAQGLQDVLALLRGQSVETVTKVLTEAGLNTITRIQIKRELGF